MSHGAFSPRSLVVGEERMLDITEWRLKSFCFLECTDTVGWLTSRPALDPRSSLLNKQR